MICGLPGPPSARQTRARARSESRNDPLPASATAPSISSIPGPSPMRILRRLDADAVCGAGAASTVVSDADDPPP